MNAQCSQVVAQVRRETGGQRRDGAEGTSQCP
jgi:hypothetical protein